jgi:hypothetical protein
MSASHEVAVRSSARQLVHAPIDRVYAAWIDPALMPTWMGGHRIAASLPLDRRGATFTEAILGPYRPRSHVIAAEPPVLHDMTGRGIFGLGYRWTTSFAEVSGGTEVRLDAAVILPLHVVGRAVRRWLAPTTLQTQTEHRLALFAQSVEGEVDGETLRPG